MNSAIEMIKSRFVYSSQINHLLNWAW